MALFKLKTAKDEFLLKALADGRLILNQRFPQKCSPRMPLAMLHKIMGEGFLFYDKQPEPVVEVVPEQTEFTPRELIVHSHYGEFPDAVATLQLARRIAVLDGRSPEEAMRHCAGLIANRVTNQKLRFTLLDMVVCKYPDNHLADIQKAIKKMAKHLRAELGEKIHAESAAELSQALYRPRKLPIPVK